MLTRLSTAVAERGHKGHGWIQSPRAKHQAIGKAGAEPTVQQQL